jgi:hypothetical protein
MWFDRFVRRPEPGRWTPAEARRGPAIPSCRVHLPPAYSGPADLPGAPADSKAACEPTDGLPFLRTHYRGIIRRV